jgi:hypothetical protein
VAQAASNLSDEAHGVPDQRTSVVPAVSGPRSVGSRSQRAHNLALWEKLMKAKAIKPLFVRFDTALCKAG